MNRRKGSMIPVGDQNKHLIVADPNKWRDMFLAHLLRACLRSHDLQVV